MFNTLFLLLFLCVFSSSNVFAYAPSQDAELLKKTPTKETLSIAVTGFNSAVRSAYLSIEKLFIKENPNAEIKFVFFNAERLKNNIENMLLAPEGPDVYSWQAGERLFMYVKKDLIFPITDLWHTNEYNKQFSPALISGVAFDSHIYAVPFNYSLWGMFYNKKLFKRLNLSPPKTWADFLLIINILKEKELTPILVGTKEPWFIANWFEYLNIRLNGITFHQQFIKGQVAGNSESIINVLTILQKLIREHYYIDNNATIYSFHDLLPLIYREQAGVMLADSSFGTYIPKSVEQHIGFFSFPLMPEVSNESVQVTPMNIMFIAKNAKNIDLAKRFISFIARPDVQSLFATKLLRLPANNFATTGKNEYVLHAQQAIKNASDLTYFFDREIDKQYGQALMDVWREFLLNPNINNTIQAMEYARQAYLKRLSQHTQ